VVAAEIVGELKRQSALGSEPAQPRKTFKGGVPGSKGPLDHSGSNSKEEWSKEAAANVHKPAFQDWGGVAWAGPFPAALPFAGAAVEAVPAVSKGSEGKAVWAESEAGAAGLPT